MSRNEGKLSYALHTAQSSSHVVVPSSLWCDYRDGYITEPELTPNFFAFADSNRTEPNFGRIRGTGQKRTPTVRRVLSRLWMRPAGVAMEMVAVVSARRVAVTTDRHRPTANPNLRTNCRRSRNRNNRDLASVSARIQQSNADTAIKIQRQMTRLTNVIRPVVQWACSTERERERERERILFATALQAYQNGYKPI